MRGGLVGPRSASRVAEEARWDADMACGTSDTPGRARESQGGQGNRKSIERSANPHRRDATDVDGETTHEHLPRGRAPNSKNAGDEDYAVEEA